MVRASKALTPRRAAHLVLQRQELREPDEKQLVQLGTAS